MSKFQFSTRVAYGDIDKNLNLTLRGAMEMMQESAIIHSSRSGYSIFDEPRTHVVWMLVDWRVRMVGTATWNDPVTVETWPWTMKKVTSERCFVIRDREGQTVAMAESNWILVNTETGRVSRIGSEVVSSYDLVDEGVFDAPMQTPAVEGGIVTGGTTVLRRDIDTNGHVNNLVYLDYAEAALPEDVMQKSFREVGVHYSRQLLLGDRVQFVYHRGEGCHQVEIRSEDGSALHAAVTFVE